MHIGQNIVCEMRTAWSNAVSKAWKNGLYIVVGTAALYTHILGSARFTEMLHGPSRWHEWAKVLRSSTVVAKKKLLLIVRS